MLLVKDQEKLMIKDKETYIIRKDGDQWVLEGENNDILEKDKDIRIVLQKFVEKSKINININEIEDLDSLFKSLVLYIKKRIIDLSLQNKELSKYVVFILRNIDRSLNNFESFFDEAINIEIEPPHTIKMSVDFDALLKKHENEQDSDKEEEKKEEEKEEKKIESSEDDLVSVVVKSLFKQYETLLQEIEEYTIIENIIESKNKRIILKKKYKLIDVEVIEEN